ncbi:WD40 repeat-containing protein [Hirschfeldia incana]|nr:WD40 repeat-containing protein [Hirschfeldia incana]
MDGTIGSKGLVKKTELVRIITDTLISLGFNGIATDLESLSGVNLLDPTIKHFLDLAERKEWNSCIELLQEEEGLQVRDERVARFLLLEQNVLDFLKVDNLDDALNTLQEEMTPLGVKERRLEKLSSKFVLPYSGEEDRFTEVMRKLRKLFPPGAIVPEGRLVCLLEKSLELQMGACDYHNAPDSDMSLCYDHSCSSKSKIPSKTVQVLVGHSDEVWFLKFSHNGKYLASSSKDNSAIIWEMNAEGGEFTQKHKLEGHEKPVVVVLWSPDDQQVITCGENEVIKRWDVGSGQCLQTYGTVDVGSFSCGWLHNGSGIIGAMADKRIYLWNLDGTEIQHVQGQRAQKISDVAMTSDGKWLVSVGREQNEISLFDRVARGEKVIVVDDMVTSFSLSRDNKYLLVSLITQEIQVWMIDGRPEAPRKVSEFKGHKRRRFVIRSCFGGYDETFIASGSEDSQVYIWHRGVEREPCCVLSGHGGAVNCVSWNPTDLHMLASGSDDRTIRIWGLDDE